MRKESDLHVFHEEAKRIMKSLGYTNRLDGQVKLNGRLSRVLGRCYSNTGLIEIQKEYFYHADADSIMNTMLHELAHRVNVHNDRHGYHWKQIAANISQNTPYNITRLAEPDKLEYRKVSDKYANFTCGCGKVHPIKLTKTKTIARIQELYECKSCKQLLRLL